MIEYLLYKFVRFGHEVALPVKIPLPPMSEPISEETVRQVVQMMHMVLSKHTERLSNTMNMLEDAHDPSAANPYVRDLDRELLDRLREDFEQCNLAWLANYDAVLRSGITVKQLHRMYDYCLLLVDAWSSLAQSH